MYQTRHKYLANPYQQMVKSIKVIINIQCDFLEKMKYLLTCSLPLNSIWHDLRDFREPQKRNCTGSLVWKRLQENV